MGEAGRKGRKGSNVQYSMSNIQCSISNVQVGGQRPTEGADLIHPRHKAVGV
jgi:hypothetical protein